MLKEFYLLNLKHQLQKGFLGGIMNNVSHFNRGNMRMPQRRFVSGGQGGRGRPQGASGRYVIPGVGVVGVYEWRRYVAQQLRLKRQAFSKDNNSICSSTATTSSISSFSSSMEARTYPDTNGKVSLTSLQKEIDDATNIVF